MTDSCELSNTNWPSWTLVFFSDSTHFDFLIWKLGWSNALASCQGKVTMVWVCNCKIRSFNKCFLSCNISRKYAPEFRRQKNGTFGFHLNKGRKKKAKKRSTKNWEREKWIKISVFQYFSSCASFCRHLQQENVDCREPFYGSHKLYEAISWECTYPEVRNNNKKNLQNYDHHQFLHTQKRGC